jgi:hypothetical protein
MPVHELHRDVVDAVAARRTQGALVADVVNDDDIGMVE